METYEGRVSVCAHSAVGGSKQRSQYHVELFCKELYSIALGLEGSMEINACRDVRYKEL